MANRFSMLLCLSAAALAVGCTPPAEFRVNRVEERKRELQALGEEGSFTPGQKTDIGTFLTAVFGTPDQPRLPAMIEELSAEMPVLRRPMLAAAAGPVASDRDGTARGLYREHCVHCHGITGDGAGPTAAFLNPVSARLPTGEVQVQVDAARRAADA
jgi:mono/diheme cytochrome c family protein